MACVGVVTQRVQVPNNTVLGFRVIVIYSNYSTGFGVLGQYLIVRYLDP